MKYIEVRRHTMRHKPGKHLTQEGVDLARQVGNDMGPFDRVITSKSARAFETAIAMGFAVDDFATELSTIPNKALSQIADASTFAEYAQAIRNHKAIARFAESQAEYWRSVAKSLQEDECALLISHGGMMEAGTVASLPEADHTAWGAGFGYCEGVRLSFDGTDFADAEILRVGGRESSREKAPVSRARSEKESKS